MRGLANYCCAAREMLFLCVERQVNAGKNRTTRTDREEPNPVSIEDINKDDDVVDVEDEIADFVEEKQREKRGKS